jgi:hypothetical protein
VRFLSSKVMSSRGVQALERVGDLLLGRFVPRIEAEAACCGSCCYIKYDCWYDTGEYQCRPHTDYAYFGLLTCYAERFEGCFVYSQGWKHLDCC